MINVQGIRRNVKNVVKNYTEAQVKVREATSNDPWGPPSTLMGEIADLTYNVVAFSEIMQMIWKRLNDHGKNWRHVYKALVLLEYLIKTGSEKVAQQCKENIFAIQTLKDFQYIEENKDQGMNVREKSKALVSLLKDDEKLKNERTRALKAKERFAQTVSYTSNSPTSETIPKTSASYHESLSSSSSLGATPKPLALDLESARPQTLGEEELQLQLALAMSKEEAEQEDRIRKSDDLRLKIALNESQRNKLPKIPPKKSAMDDLLSLNVGSAQAKDPWSSPLNGGGDVCAGAVAAAADPWTPEDDTHMEDPWNVQHTRSVSAPNDPWQSSPPSTTPVTADIWSCDYRSNLSSPANNGSPGTSGSNSQLATRKTPETFLGANSNLVNLDALVSNKTTPTLLPMGGGNPFQALTGTGASASNPFQAAKPPPPTINQLRAQGQPLIETTINSDNQPNQAFFMTPAGIPSTNFQMSPSNNNPFAM